MPGCQYFFHIDSKIGGARRQPRWSFIIWMTLIAGRPSRKEVLSPQVGEHIHPNAEGGDANEQRPGEAAQGL